MSYWIKEDAREVYMNIAGNVGAEHAECLWQRLMDRFQYGYRRIIVDISEVKQFDATVVAMLLQVRERILKKGGILIVKDANGFIGRLDFVSAGA